MQRLLFKKHLGKNVFYTMKTWCEINSHLRPYLIKILFAFYTDVTNPVLHAFLINVITFQTENTFYETSQFCF